jgi:tetratricopeptide (TPR) repeat protein
MASLRRRIGLTAAFAATATVAVTIALVAFARAERASYVRDTLALVAEAARVHSRGDLAGAVRLAAAASTRLHGREDWFHGDQALDVSATDSLLRRHLKIWTEAETARTDLAAEPGKVRRALEALLERAAADGDRARPIQAKLLPALGEAKAAERDRVREKVGNELAEARRRYEAREWAAFTAGVEGIRAAIQSLPADARAGFEEPKDLYRLADLLADADRSAAGAAADEPDWVKADRLRDLLERAPSAQEGGALVRQELLDRAWKLDRETRAPIEAIKLPEANRKSLVEAFTRWGGGVELLPGAGDPAEGFVLQGPRHRFAVRVIGPQPRVLVETDRVRLAFDIGLISGRESFALETSGALARGLRATRHDRVFADEPWVVVANAPGPCAVQGDGDKAYIFLEGRVYEGTRREQDPDDSARVGSFLSRARLLEAVVRNNDSIPLEIRGPVTALLRAAHTRAAPKDYLDGQFCREAIHRGYLEAHVPVVDESVADRLKGYRDAYAEVIRFRRRLEGAAPDGGMVDSSANLEGETLWRLYDPTGPATTFAIEPRDPMGTHLVVHTTFAGKHEEWPEQAEPIRIRMFHPAAGEIARWESSTGALAFDAERWTRALRTDEPPGVPDHFGTADWRVPPHVVRIDERGRPVGLYLPNGFLKVGPFPPGPDRRKAQDRFLDDCAKLLRTPGELHLFYRYFIQYVLDSPVTTSVTLIGSSRHTGEVHQDAYETLDRWVAGRYLADCDDLAELYQAILKRQGRLAYVLGVPGHATCGLAEKEGDEWVFFCVDTGPPRLLRHKDLDKVLENLLLTYDDEGDMSFDPRSIRFMFRFAGEQTRSDYYLDSRMFRDPEYAETMIRVQEFWHFSFYALGIETMLKVLETDKMPANCSEIAGLYMRVGQYEEALRWIDVGIAGLDPADPLSRLNEVLRKASCLRELDRKDDAARALKEAAAELAAIAKEKPEEAGRYRRLRFTIATSLAEAGDPWGGWELVAVDVRGLLFERGMADTLGAEVTHIYSKMQEEQRLGEKLTEAQLQEMAALETLLGEFFEGGLFRGDDSFNSLIRKYTILYDYKAAKEGPDAAAAQLLKPEYPQGRRRHETRRGDPPDLDWRWLRISPFNYGQAVGHFLDKKRKREDGPARSSEAIRALEGAIPEIQKHGSLGPFEFSVLGLKLVRGCLEMDETAIRAVLDEMKRQAWGRLYESLAETLGRTARHMKVEDFEKVFRLFCSYEPPRRHYYGVVYPAFQDGAARHAIGASRICVERFPADKDMRREHQLLLKLGEGK